MTTTISGQVLALLTVTETIQSAASTVVVFTTNGSELSSCRPSSALQLIPFERRRDGDSPRHPAGYRVYDFEYGQHDAANYVSLAFQAQVSRTSLTSAFVLQLDHSDHLEVSCCVNLRVFSFV